MLMRHAPTKKYEADFARTSITPADPAFENDEVVQRARAFLDAWTNKRWVLWPPSHHRCCSDRNQMAPQRATPRTLRAVRPHELGTEKGRDRPSVQIRGTATVNGKSTNLQFRMTFELTNGDMAMSGDANTAWRVAIWAPDTYLEDSTESEHAD